jgi:hypothetical protein
MWYLRRLYALSRVLQVSIDITFSPSPNATMSNSIVHEVHPMHPFLDMKVKPASETLDHSEISHSEISEGIIAADDNVDESRQRAYIHSRRFPLTLCFWVAPKHAGYKCS